MTINLTVPDDNETPRLKPKLTVIGVGGAGGNAVNNMIRSELEGVDFVVANTDAQALTQSRAERRIQLGMTITEGLGAGSRPEVGRAAAEEAIEEIHGQLDGAHMLFIAAGMGGGTGTGGAPVVARVARENGILTVGVVTKPFHFEGTHRMRQAEEGIAELEQYVDTLIVIPNQNLFRIANEKTTFADAFAMADEVLYSGVRGVTDLMVMPGLINLDFADIRSVMSEMGKAMMGTGEADGERRALDAAEAAIANPLLDDTSMKGAKGVLINITGGMDITLFEVDEAANRIRAEVDQDAYIIVGSAFDSSLDGIMRVSVVATGIDSDASEMPLPTMLHLAEQLDYSSVSEPASETTAEDVVEADADVAFVAEAAAEDQPPPAAELPIETMVEASAETVDQTVDDSAGEESKPETPPAAMLAVGASDAFIPPRPVEAKSGGESEEADHLSVAAPADDDAPETSPEAPKRAKAASLFERVTGGRAVFGRKSPAPEKETEAVENKGLSVTDETTATAPDEDEAAKVAAPDKSADAGDEIPPLGGVDPADRSSGGEIEEDLLDIPAFLRRQAN